MPSAEFVSDPFKARLRDPDSRRRHILLHQVAMINGIASCFNRGRRREDDRMFWAHHGSAVLLFWRWCEGASLGALAVFPEWQASGPASMPR